METTAKAQKQFESGLNCAQSVLSSFSGSLKFNEDLALDITSGFGAGMGKLQQTCGAVTGAYMVLGVHCSKNQKDRIIAKEDASKMIQDFEQRFKMLHGTTQCNELIPVDLNTAKGQEAFKEYNMKDNVCMKCVKNSVDILNEMLLK
jgi:C_GCAxxG_C_C family probable redox protein